MLRLLCLLILIGGSGGWVRQALAQPTDVQRNRQIDQILDFVEQGDRLQSQNKAREALQSYQSALAICPNVYQNKHEVWANVLERAGVMMYRLGDLKGARTMQEGALKMRRELFGNQAMETVASCNKLGMVAADQGDLKVAREVYREALQILSAKLPADSPDLALAYNNLGSIEKRTGNLSAARELLLKALKIAEAKLGVKHEFTLATLNNLGDLEDEAGNLTAARQYYERALPAAKLTFGEFDERIAILHNNLGNLFKSLGQAGPALQSLEQALLIRRKMHGEKHPAVANSLNNIAVFQQEQGDWKKAAENYQNSLTILQTALGKEHPLTIATQGNLGTVQRQLQQYEAAQQNQEAALKLKQKVFGEQHPQTAVSHQNLAWLYVSQNRMTEARQQAETALKIYSAVLGEQHPSTIQVRMDVGLLNAHQGHFGTAAEQFHQSRVSIKTFLGRSLSGLTDQEQLIFIRTNDERHLQNCLAFGYCQRQNLSLVNLSAEWLLNGKALTQSVLAEQAFAAQDLKNPKLAENVQALQQTRRNLSRLTLAQPNSKDTAEHKLKLQNLAAEEERLSRAVVAGNGRTSSTKFRWVELASLRKAIPADTVLVDIAAVRETDFQAPVDKNRHIATRYVAWIIPAAEQGDVKIVDLGEINAIEDLLRKARPILQTTPAKNTSAEFGAELKQLAELLWVPISQQLSTQIKHLVISPDGDLWTFPWAVLPLDSQTFLLEKYSVRYVTHARTLLTPPSKEQTSAPVIFSDPDFDLSADATRAAVQTIFPKLALNSPGIPSPVKSTLPKVSRLPFTKLEAEAVLPKLKQLANQEPINYTRNFALETVFHHLNHPRMLLLSTHGYFLSAPESEALNSAALLDEASDQRLKSRKTTPTDNPLLRCGLLFAGCNQQQPTAGDDGILTGMEIVGRDLRGTELVVLSACETGLGQLNVGQGIAGLRQSFQIAGARSVAATLWQVPDRESAVLVNDFFEQLAAGNSSAEALRLAQIKRIHALRERFGAAYPFYWAAWTLTGN